MGTPEQQTPSFEETYSKHEFSELVRLAVVLATMWRRAAGRREAATAPRVRPPRFFSRPRLGKPVH